MTTLEELVLAGGQKCGGLVRVVRTSPRLDAVRSLEAKGLVQFLPGHDDATLILEFRLTPEGHRAASLLLRAA